MAYKKTTWMDRVIEKPNTYRTVENQDGTITLYPVTGQVIEKGTAVSAANLNKIEDQLEKFDEDLEHIVYIPKLVIGIDNKIALQTAINYCEKNNLKLGLNEGEYLISETLNINNLIIETIGSVTIKVIKNVNIFNVNGRLKVFGELILDANNLANNCIYINSELPYLDKVIFKNSVSYCIENNSQTVSGECYLNECETIDCISGTRIVGDMSTSVKQINCKTMGDTGSDGNCYFYSNHNFVEIEGGEFTGNSNTAPNIYMTNNVIVNGGKYENMLRGVTIGRQSKNIIVTNTLNIGCSYSGIQIDVKDTDGTIPSTYGTVSGNTIKNCGYCLYIQAKDLSIVSNYMSSFTKSEAIRVNGGDNIFVDGNTILGCIGTKSMFNIAQNSTIKIGKNLTDSTDLGFRTENLESKVYFTDIKTVTSNYVARLQDEIIIVDCSTNSVDIDLPRKLYGNSYGKIFKIIRVDNSSSNRLTVSLANGDGTINGSVSAIELPKDQYKIYEIISIGEGNYIMNI